MTKISLPYLLIVIAYVLLIGGGIMMLQEKESDFGIIAFMGGVVLYLVVRIVMRRKRKVKN